MARCLILLSLLFAGCTPSLHDTVTRGDMVLARTLLEENPERVHAVNELHQTPLHYAASNNQTEMLPLLLEFGANVNAGDVTGLTPLHLAAMRGRNESVEWLIEQGAALEAQDAFGDTPLHTAAIFYGRSIGILVERGADLQARNKEGLTPVQVAQKYNKAREAAYLEKLQKRSIS